MSLLKFLNILDVNKDKEEFVEEREEET